MTKSTAALLVPHTPEIWPLRRQESRWIHTFITYANSRRQISRAAVPHFLSPPHRMTLNWRDQPAGSPGGASLRWRSHL